MASAKLRDTISECIYRIQSDCDDETKEKALQTLVSITKTSPSYRNLVAQNNEVIPTVLKLLKSSSRTLEKLSLSVLFSLSLNLNLKANLADMDTIQHLNTVILSRGSLESSKLAASLICSLAMLDKNKAVFGVANTIQTLLKAVSRPKSPVTHHLLSSLAELVHFHGNCTLAVRSGAVSVLLGIVENQDSEDLSGTSLVILGLLARFNEGLKALTNTSGIVSRMLDVLKVVVMIEYWKSAECLKEAMGSTDLVFVLAEVTVRGSTRAREKASLLMRKLEADEFYAEDNIVFLQWFFCIRNQACQETGCASHASAKTSVGGNIAETAISHSLAKRGPAHKSPIVLGSFTIGLETGSVMLGFVEPTTMPADITASNAVQSRGADYHWNNTALRTKVVASVVSCLLVALSGKGEKKRQKEGKLLI
ncbi:U-box domain-containing protein 39 [Tanacetum coccineum]